MPDYSDDLALLEEAARAAGEIAQRRFKDGARSWQKAGGSPVTEADLEIDDYLNRTLRAARPDYGWLSEESPDDATRLSRETVFIVDPIDGTIAFLKGRPHFTICIAVAREGVPVAGVVHNPILDTLYAARAGAGAHANGKAIHVSARTALEGCAMLGDRTILEQPPWPAMVVENRNSVAYRIALVADGSFDATVSLSAKRDWDLAAADIIVREAGGWIGDFDGNALRYNSATALQPGFVAAAHALAPTILARARDLRQ